MMTQNEELQKGKIFADDLMHVASASCERMAKERIELLCQLQQAKAAVRADSSKSVPEGWEPSKDCVHALRTGDGVWLRNEGMQFFRQGDWYGLSPLSNGTPSVKGCTYRILIEKGAK
jgi:hypothetical protein